MPRLAWIGPLTAVLCLPTAGRCEDQPRPADVAALQNLIQKTIDRTEPSVACILVSRSDEYKRFETVPTDEGSASSAGSTGPYSRGRFFPDDHEQGRARVARLAQTIDLSRTDAIPESFGSGVVIDADNGLVLTMAHVIHDATKIYVRLPGGRGGWADIHAADPRSDLAVLRLLDPPADLKAVKRGDGSNLRKGQPVICLANPYAAGFRDGSPSALWGIVSNLHRRASGVTGEIERPGVKPTLHHDGTLIQTDVRPALGCSGGGLFNLNGELIGLTTAQAGLAGSEAPGGFAVPLDGPMKRIIDVLARGDEVEYGFLGVQFAKESRSGPGVTVTGVEIGSPAATAGLLHDDVITAINGSPISDNDDLYLQIGLCPAGGEARIEAIGSGRPAQDLHGPAGQSYTPGKAIASHRPPARCRPPRGLRQHPGPARWPASPAGGRGHPRGRAGQSGRQGPPPGGLCHHVVGGRPVTTPAEFYDAMAKAEGPVELSVLNPEGREDRVTIDPK